MSSPLVSVIVPAHDAEPFLAAALDSVLAQRHRPLEVVVVDDCSADGTARIAASYGSPVTVVTGRFGSAAAARNAGLRHAHGDLIAFLDADDIWLPASLDVRVDRLLASPADYAIGLVTAVPEAPGSWPSWAPAAWRGAQLSGHLDAFLGRREAIEPVGGFDPDYAPCEDVDWLARVKDSGARGLLVERVCARYRLRPGGTSGSGEKERHRQLLRALHASVRRARRAEAAP